jgi:diguanylate cyclase (GGDEF)-like protein
MPRRTIVGRLLRAAFTLYLAVALSLTLALVAGAYVLTRSMIERELRQDAEIFAPTLAVALWSMDDIKLETVVRGMVGLPAIGGLRIVDPRTGHVFVVATKRFGDATILHDASRYDLRNDTDVWDTARRGAPAVTGIDIVYRHERGVETLGRAEIFADVDGFVAELTTQASAIIGVAFLKEAALWGIFLLVGRRVVARPLADLIRSLDAIRPDRPSRVDLSPDNVRTVEGTELEGIRDTVNTLLQRIDADRHTLAAINEGLEQQVAERTAALQEANEKLFTLAVTDSLTGVSNRRYFIERADELITLSRRIGMEVSLLVLDLDHFKAVNDTYGHPVGDAVLHAVAEAARSQVRKTDLLARLGGEEFALLLPDTGMGDAAIRAEQLRRAIEDTELGGGELGEGGAQGVRVTVSIGVAELGHDEPFAALYRRADEALYAAKIRGRNRVELAPSDTPFILSGAQ